MSADLPADLPADRWLRLFADLPAVGLRLRLRPGEAALLVDAPYLDVADDGGAGPDDGADVPAAGDGDTAPTADGQVAVVRGDPDAAVAWLRGIRGRSAVAAERRAAHAGTLRLDGRSLRWRSVAGRVRAGLVTVTDVVVAPEVSVVDHLAARVPPAVARERLGDVPHLADRLDDPAGVLSGGERRLLAWARASALRPRVVVLDRAGTGLDGDALAWASTVVTAWREAGVCVLVRPGRVEEHAWTDQPSSP